ncbi:hypothetical protein KGF54_003225 [Candida jiufengensis]|uniref:uncharacterized protein n=1 Tax=Candida jiufengensis TaxID=497108 RepID=UPI0022256FC1|nr:uncharacterized protein KGF54_003225 [Candida jiufengensis]KAI5952359.1 hypothetical protein KGF54_003225 [Candida jiufengensis]
MYYYECKKFVDIEKEIDSVQLESLHQSGLISRPEPLILRDVDYQQQKAKTLIIDDGYKLNQIPPDYVESTENINESSSRTINEVIAPSVDQFENLNHPSTQATKGTQTQSINQEPIKPSKSSADITQQPPYINEKGNKPILVRYESTEYDFCTAAAMVIIICLLIGLYIELKLL